MSDDIDPDRKFSNGTDWDNSIDCDDASDGSDGGYDRHGSPINANAMKELVQLRMETSRLRAELAAVTEERDALAARLAPVEDEELVEIATREIFIERRSLAAAIAAIRPHIEAAERERCAKIAETPDLWVTDKPSRGCDDIAAAIRSGK